ncbi:MAG: hypothetical protein M5U25_12670 [Planctomycetota bacterium]|nr:hypothetical protein [Planctomycetota bacterium]
MNLREQEDACLVPTYAKLPLSVVRGEDVWVWDDKGEKIPRPVRRPRSLRHRPLAPQAG